MLANLLTLALATSVAALPATSALSERASPDPTQVYINRLVYGGTGCPQGSVGSYISPDRQTFTLIFDKYVASVGPNVDIIESRKNCQLNLELRYPGGFQYSILNTVFRGYAGLDAGVTGIQSTTYYFSGEAAQATASTTLRGPMDGNYQTADNLDIASTVWSPCGASTALNINSAIRLQSSQSSARGLLTDDSIDGKVSFVVGVQWRAC